MTTGSLTTKRRAAATLLAALAVAVMGVVPAASAQSGPITPQNGGASISGTLEVPPGVNRQAVWVEVAHYATMSGVTGWFHAERAEVAADGSFVISGLEAGREYRLSVWPRSISGSSLVGGYYTGPGSPYGYRPVDGVGLKAPGSGLDLKFEERGEITGTITLPSHFDTGSGNLPSFIVYDTTYEHSGSQTGPFKSSWWALMHGNYSLERVGPRTYEFSAKGVREGVPHAVAIYRYGDGGFADGYVHAGSAGLVSNPEHATLVYAGQHITGEVTGRHTTPRLNGYVAPRVTGEAHVGGELSFIPAQWSMKVDSERYQWLRDGQPVAGQTGQRYTLTEADLGARISVRGTATKSGFSQAQILSQPTDVVTVPPVPQVPEPDPEVPTPSDPDLETPALEATTAPKVSGTARLGKKLKASKGSWSVGGVSVSYQWLRAGKAIKGATKRTYKVKKKDVGKRVSVRVTASKTGHDDGASSSKARKVKKASTSLKVTAKTVRVSKRPRVVVRVKASGYAKPAGTVRIKVGKKTYRAKLRASAQGKLTVRLPKLAKGKHKITVRYTPSSKTAKYLTKPKAKKTTLRVR